uniref:Uncharacterized protein n=1 Tax=viral metagenome TaxID=1070528 RepID=A0A6M3K2W9_9ZZZZ
MLKLYKEPFVGKYHGNDSPILLGIGDICDGKNVRKAGPRGGWKPRKGCTLHNTTTIAAAPVKSLHQYTHPRNSDYHFIAQCNSNLYDATNDPPATGTTFGSSISTLAGTTSGFSDMVKEWWLYADGSGGPVVWGGDTPFCTGFVVWDNSESAYIDYTRIVSDNDSSTEAIVLGAASDVYYVCSPEIAEAITLDLGSTVNAAAATATVSSWQSGAWSDRSASDGTAAAGATHAIDGSLTWTRSANDTMRVIGGIMGYWYKVSFSGALTGSVDVISCKVICDPARMTNKWNGVYQIPTGIRFYDASATEYEDYLGQLSNVSTSQYLQLNDATTSDFIYIKSPEPLCGLGFGVVAGYEQTDNAQVDSIEYWDGDSWNAITTGIIDETLDGGADSSFAQSGTIWWNAAGLTVHKRTMPFDSGPGYWYRVSWDATLTNAGDDIRVCFITTATFPKALGAYSGVVEFKGRALLWGDTEFPNRLRFSAYDAPDCFSGDDSGYTDIFGNMEEIVCAKRFYNELLVFKEHSIWLLEGYDPSTFGVARVSETVGTCAPKSVQIAEAGFPGMNVNEPLTIVAFMDTDGVYVIDGKKPRKVSGPVDHYFNTEYSTAIGASNIPDCHAHIDPLNNEYQLHGSFLETVSTLVYNYVSDEWYPPFDRNSSVLLAMSSAVTLRGTDGRYYCYAGAYTGYVARLENDTTDKNSSNQDVIITHQIKTRAISLEQKLSTTLRFDFRRANIEAQARSSGTITTKFYKDLATSGTTIAIPAAISLVNTGYNLVTDGLDVSQYDCSCFQLEFIAATADLELEIWSILYEVEARGEIAV